MRVGLWVKPGIYVTSSQSSIHKSWFGHSSIWTEEHSYLLVWLGGVVSQQRAAEHSTSTSELGLQWVISSQCRVWGLQEGRIPTRLRLNAIAGAIPGLSIQSPPDFRETGISYLIGHWWVALFPQTLVTEAESKRNSKHLIPNLPNNRYIMNGGVRKTKITAADHHLLFFRLLRVCLLSWRCRSYHVLFNNFSSLISVAFRDVSEI